MPTVTTHDVIGDLPFVKEEGIEVTGRWASALNEIPPGMNYKALTAWAGHPKPLFVAETKFWNFLLKLSPDLPSGQSLRSLDHGQVLFIGKTDGFPHLRWLFYKGFRRITVFKVLAENEFVKSATRFRQNLFLALPRI